MKQRIITAIVALGILCVIIGFFETPAFNFAIGVLSAVAVYELLHSTGYVENRFVLSVCIIFAFIFPALHFKVLNRHIILVSMLFLVVLGFCFLVGHDTISLQAICTGFLVSLVVPVVFSVSIVIRDRFYPDGLFFYLLALAGGWLTDSGAYFIGVFFGKHKLAPNISPKKTIEGAVGGLVTTVIGYLLLGFGYSLYRGASGDSITVAYPVLAAGGLICAIAAILGDLFASVIKRQTGIKDYGHIFPGHGGVMDRFDSVLFVSPVIYAIISFFPIIARG